MSRHWWQDAIIYQVYPRSFMDADGNGIGDLPGLLARLDYLGWLGVDTLWLSPVFQSPMADFGYDVSDYTRIDPSFGTLDDFRELVAAAHRRGMRLLLDFVPNHTSDQHAWFLEARASRSAAKRDWYIWRDPASGGGPPNNWLSHFGGSAWEWDQATGQFYYHAFLKEQPDLNWRQPAVARAMLQVLRYWLDLGVDGFRVDVIWHLIKDDEFRDNPPNPEFRDGMSPYRRLIPEYSADRPGVHDVIDQMRRVLAEYRERMLLGEIYLPIERLVTYYRGGDGLAPHLPFNFTLVQVPWMADALAGAIDAYDRALPPEAWPTWVLGNHDKPRIASRVGPAQSRVAAMLLLTLRGTPTIYYGDEIGMPDGAIPDDRVCDPKGRNLPGLGRDPVRTPMQWQAGAGAGFTSGEPWLPFASTDPGMTVDAQRDDPASMLSLYRRLIALRRHEPVLARGTCAVLAAPRPLLAYLRDEPGRGSQAILVVLNLSHAAQTFQPPAGLAGRVALSTALDREGERVDGAIDLRPDEGIMVRIEEEELRAEEREMSNEEQAVTA